MIRSVKLSSKNSGAEIFSPESVARLAKAQGQKAKGIEFEPRRSLNFLLGTLRPGGFRARKTVLLGLVSSAAHVRSRKK